MSFPWFGIGQVYRGHRAEFNPIKRWWWRKIHEVCCNFDESLAAFLAPRLELFAEDIHGAPGGYPDPDKACAEGTPDKPLVTDFEAWERDIKRVATAARGRLERDTNDDIEYEEEEAIEREWRWALEWLARWSGDIWH